MKCNFDQSGNQTADALVSATTLRPNSMMPRCPILILVNDIGGDCQLAATTCTSAHAAPQSGKTQTLARLSGRKRLQTAVLPNALDRGTSINPQFLSSSRTAGTSFGRRGDPIFVESHMFTKGGFARNVRANRARRIRPGLLLVCQSSGRHASGNGETRRLGGDQFHSPAYQSPGARTHRGKWRNI